MWPGRRGEQCGGRLLPVLFNVAPFRPVMWRLLWAIHSPHGLRAGELALCGSGRGSEWEGLPAAPACQGAHHCLHSTHTTVQSTGGVTLSSVEEGGGGREREGEGERGGMKGWRGGEGRGGLKERGGEWRGGREGRIKGEGRRGREGGRTVIVPLCMMAVKLLSDGEHPASKATPQARSLRGWVCRDDIEASEV